MPLWMVYLLSVQAREQSSPSRMRAPGSSPRPTERESGRKGAAHDATSRLLLVAVKPLWDKNNFSFVFVVVLGRFLAKVGPKTPFNGSGSRDDAERTQN